MAFTLRLNCYFVIVSTVVLYVFYIIGRLKFKLEEKYITVLCIIPTQIDFSIKGRIATTNRNVYLIEYKLN